MSQLHEILASRFGFTSFRPGQEDAIRSILDKQHTLVVMPTGAGKSLIYQLAALCLPEPAVTLVLSPLIALMQDQIASLNRYRIPAVAINSALSAEEQQRCMYEMTQGQYRLVYIAPERLRNVAFQKALRQVPIGLLVIDEAHCISHWGHDFRPDYRRIAPVRAEMGNPLTVALTATATTLVQADIVGLLNINDARRIVTGFNRPNLSFEVYYTSDNTTKRHLITQFLDAFREPAPQGTALVYTGTRRTAEEVADYLSTIGRVRAQYYHAGLSSEQRSNIQHAFIKGKLPVLVATNAFGMGIDRPDVRLVAHYNLTGTLEAYYQEAGRAGRDGQPSRAVLLYSPKDRILQQRFIEQSTISWSDLQEMYRLLERNQQSNLGLTLEVLAGRAGVDEVKVRIGLALLERAGMIQELAYEGAQIGFALQPWHDDAVSAMTNAMYEYARHRQAQLDQMTDYAESDSCRREILLRYFSDQSPPDALTCCDNCIAEQLPPPEPGDVASLSRAERAALIILDSVRRLPWGIGRQRLADILKGSQSRDMTETYRKQHYYGRFSEFTHKQIETMIEQLIIQGHLKIVGGDKPVIALSHRGAQVLNVRSAIPLHLPGDPIARNGAGTAGLYTEHAISPTQKETERLFRQGMTPDAIATARAISARSIYRHLAALIGAGRIPLTDVVNDTVVTQVRQVIEPVSDLSRLAPLKALLPDTISYNELHCVVEDIKRQRNQPPEPER
ncbi:MAG: RecQ family ATP-dependent DNA helicase [Chloroflexaceae bacterium]|nr:RecQ family ATP-dependent DNA helicase [Chloroflexaceae bacterium]